MIKRKFQLVDYALNYIYVLTLIVKELKISVEQGRVVTTLNIIKH